MMFGGYGSDEDMFEDDNQKQVKICKNGDSSIFMELLINDRTTFAQIQQRTSKKMGWGKKQIRNFKLFNKQGVELMESELRYLISSSVLYASSGEDFDQASLFSDYKIIKKIGQGGFGAIYLGIHKNTGEKVALKFVNGNSYGGNADAVSGIWKEAETLKTLDHPNIVKILNTIPLKELSMVMIMEYYEGGELGDVLLQKGGKIGEPEARKYFNQIASGISHCHQASLIHRDLKLANILLSDKIKKQIKIIDFGIAGVQAGVHTDVDDPGTDEYLPPEVLQGHKDNVTPKWDIWAMGIMLYTMLIGKLPFDREKVSDKKFIENVIKHEVKFPKENKLSTEVKDLIRCTLKKNPKDRINMLQIEDHPWVLGKKIKRAFTIVEEHEEEEEKYDEPVNRKVFPIILESKKDYTSKRQTVKNKYNKNKKKVSFNKVKINQVKKGGPSRKKQKRKPKKKTKK